MNRFLRREQMLGRRRQQLLAESAQARAQIVSAVAGVEAGLASWQRVYQAGQWVHSNRLFVGAGLLALLAFRRTRGLAHLAVRGWTLWRGWRALSR